MSFADLDREIANVTSAVTRNRLIAVRKSVSSVDAFMALKDQDFLSIYRQTPLGKKSSCDLGGVTYTAFAAIKANLKAKAFEEKREAELAQKAEMWFTRDDMTTIASFMDAFKIEKIELRKIRELLSALVKEKPNVQTKPTA